VLHYLPALPYLVCTAILLGTSVLVFQRLVGAPAVIGAVNPAK
jgi:hypothetical protein